MKIVHLSDTHLGHRGLGFQRLVADPWRPAGHLRQQESDIMLGLARAIDRIVRDLQPDLVIHSGDLFDSARPSPYHLNFAMAQVRRLSDAGISVIIVEGNHSWPRDRSHGHALHLLAHLPRVTVVCDEPTEFRLPGLSIHTLPHEAAARGVQPSVIARTGTHANVLVSHGVADGLHFFKTGRSAPDLAIVPCAESYEYVALGHCHRFSQVPGTTQAFYAGATAMVLPGDFHPGHQFGFILVTLDAGQPIVERQEIVTRSMHAYGLDDAEGLTALEVLDFLAQQADAAPPDAAYCRVVIERLDPLVRRELATSAVEEIFATAAGRMISIHTREQRWEAVRARLIAGGGPLPRFAQLAAGTDGEAEFKAEVLALGQDLLARAAEQVVQDDLGSPGRGGDEEET